MNLNQIICGDCNTVLRTFDDEVFNCCVTSPPYWGLRDYGIKDQIGLEKTPEEYIDKLVMIFKDVKRTLKKDGTLWLNIADSYYGSGKGSGGTGILSAKQNSNKNANFAAGGKALKIFPHPILKPKDMCLIPFKIAIELQKDGWYVRSDIIWAKSNPMPEGVFDRPTKSYEHLFLFSKSADYYYDQIFEPYAENSDMQYRKTLRCGRKYGVKRPYQDNQPLSYSNNPEVNPEGKNKRDVWLVNNKGQGNEHIASFPIELIQPCIIAGCPQNGIVLDPFMGSGTTAKAALQNNRNFIGIELNPKYIQNIANYRVESAKTGISEKEIKNGQKSLFFS